MTTVAESADRPRLTARGEKTRGRIISTAADLMWAQGVAATTLDEIVAASEVSKSQLYHHFSGKDELVRAVIGYVGERVIQREQKALGEVSTIDGLRRWRDALVRDNALRHGAYGCALGSLAAGVADQDDAARDALTALFSEWEGLLAGALRRLQGNGSLPAKAPIDHLATGLLAALQGGYVLAQTAHDVAPMAASIDMALSYVESLTVA
jgi:AcrR family transcriptional regulator